MKRKVIFSASSIFTTMAALAILISLTLLEAHHQQWAGVYILAAATTAICIAALIYAPKAISISDSTLTIHRAISNRTIPLSEIASVGPVPPIMVNRRLLASGGIFGYWGWMKEDNLGVYFASYGRSSDRFLITLRDGRHYIFGCADAPEIITQVKKEIHC